MGVKEDILTFLQDNPGQHSVDEIVKAIKGRQIGVRTQLGKLTSKDLVRREPIPGVAPEEGAAAYTYAAVGITPKRRGRPKGAEKSATDRSAQKKIRRSVEERRAFRKNLKESVNAGALDFEEKLSKEVAQDMETEAFAALDAAARSHEVLSHMIEQMTLEQIKERLEALERTVLRIREALEELDNE